MTLRLTHEEGHWLWAQLSKVRRYAAFRLGVEQGEEKEKQSRDMDVATGMMQMIEDAMKQRGRR